MKKGLLVIPILAVVLIGDYFYSMYNVAPELNFDALSLTTLNGDPVRITNYKGKKLFLHFVGPTLKSFADEVSSLELAQSKLSNDNFLFLCISDEPVEALKNFQQKTSLRLPILHLKEKLKDLKIRRLPTTYVLNPNGELVYKKTGDKDWEDSESIHELRKTTE